MDPDTEDDFELVPVWDLFIRVVHWGLVVLVCAAWGLGKWGPVDRWMHFWLGYLIGGVVVARIVWGFVGPHRARFESFVRGPRAVMRYARQLGRREPSYWRGHNPLGAVSVLLMLGGLLLQVATGLFADPDDYINIGPLADWIGYERAVLSADLHGIIANFLLFVVLAHVAAILWYRLWKREDLVSPMWTGQARWPRSGRK